MSPRYTSQLAVNIKSETHTLIRTMPFVKVFSLFVSLLICLLLLNCALQAVFDDSVEKRIKRNRSIVDFGYFNASSLSDRLRLRAGPNARLITAFGIHNSLTTTNESEHKQFLKLAVRAIKSARQDVWHQLDRCALSLLTSELAAADQGKINLERTARIMCFEAVLQLFFSDKYVGFNADAADGATSIINMLWLESKKEPDEASLLFQKRQLDTLHLFLDQLVPGHDKDALALIIPAYETLWRVVLLAYVHVAFRHIDDETSSLLARITQKMNKNGHQPLPLDTDADRFAREALRLYPPTKRIYRASRFRQAAADVESLHHDEEIWGSDALQFRPSRFSRLSKHQTEAYMPFGAGPNICPAASGFGRKIIVVLVMALLNRLGTKESGAKISYGDDNYLKDETVPLPTGRDKMGAWSVMSTTTPSHGCLHFDKKKMA
ncbi:hypothetical protein CDD82_2021 [Ophiocordyceps australis]|uniref:Cytochrome P450 n=1 Tax=Ophiocordyceps australis TaxID=1399860 RepID=A0A2C5Y3Q1_9HYPO|nr:hypothetical protein CDD82_2021 [Ophiocordyceps australis]